MSSRTGRPQVLARPRSGFAARIAGLNMVRGTLEGHGVRAPTGLLIEGIAEEPVTGRGSSGGVPAQRCRGVQATARRQPAQRDRRHHHGARTARGPDPGPHRRLSADVTTAAVADLDLVPQTPVVFAVKASEVAIYRA